MLLKKTENEQWESKLNEEETRRITSEQNLGRCNMRLKDLEQAHRAVLAQVKGKLQLQRELDSLKEDNEALAEKAQQLDSRLRTKMELLAKERARISTD